MSCVLNRPQDIINYISNGIKFNEFQVKQFGLLLDGPRLKAGDVISVVSSLRAFEVQCSNNKSIKFADFDVINSHYNGSTVVPGRFDLKEGLEVTAASGSIELSGGFYYSDVEFHCANRIIINNTNFNPEKKISINGRVLTAEEVSYISGNPFNGCHLSASVEIEASDSDFDGAVEFIKGASNLELREVIRDSLQDAIEDLEKFKGLETDYLDELEKCANPQDHKFFNISCSGVQDFVFSDQSA